MSNIDKPLQIDLQAIINKRLSPRKRRLVPRMLVRCIERIICQDELNGILRRTYPSVGTAFAEGVLQDMNITLKTEGEENIPDNGRFIFASNHPLGGLDGIALIAVLGKRYGDERLRFPVNDLLLNVRPLDGIFVGINKFGHQGRTSASQLNEIYASDDKQVVIFPAGLVSRLGKRGKIADLEWQKAFVAKAVEYGRDIIPIHITARNTMLFYRTARLRKLLHIGINLEQALLPSELIKARGKEFTIIFGKPIACHELCQRHTKPKDIAQEIKRISEELA